MRTLVMDIEDFLANEWVDSDVHPFIRPPVVNWKKEPLPDYIFQKYDTIDDIFCCNYGYFSGFGGYGYYPSNPPSPVPETSAALMFGSAFLMMGLIGLYKRIMK